MTLIHFDECDSKLFLKCHSCLAFESSRGSTRNTRCCCRCVVGSWAYWKLFRRWITVCFWFRVVRGVWLFPLFWWSLWSSKSPTNGGRLNSEWICSQDSADRTCSLASQLLLVLSSVLKCNHHTGARLYYKYLFLVANDEITSWLGSARISSNAYGLSKASFEGWRWWALAADMAGFGLRSNFWSKEQGRMKKTTWDYQNI